VQVDTSAYQGMTEPNHRCQEPRSLQVSDSVTVKNVTPTSLLVTGPCGCDFLLWEPLPVAFGESDSAHSIVSVSGSSFDSR
jgi:hypothetical protein